MNATADEQVEVYAALGIGGVSNISGQIVFPLGVVGISDDQMQVEVEKLREAKRVAAITEERDRRIAAACGDESERIRILAESLATLYLALRPTLSDSVKSPLDANMTKLQSAGSIRTRAAQMIQDKTLDWN